MAGLTEDSERQQMSIGTRVVETEWVSGSARWCAVLIDVAEGKPLRVLLNSQTLPVVLLPCVERWVRRSLLMGRVGVVVLFSEELRFYGAPSRQQ